ncbi:DUF4832 domain-containing protein [Cohnella xylanilytica]|uniref:DUF4832 domain-containing protein n=1 Tax=Cohnella xylanilytica TaxID=557555 RepID=A0A841U8J3_9BACL|nr:DUF4832 domain-containing protein [Cohnella xylanilytica]MBB6694573.1 DUF4832 domain-containing protein [Cohnella xylanilytica]
MAMTLGKRRWLRTGAAFVLASSLAVPGAGAYASARTAGEGARFDGQPGQWSGVPSASTELSQTLQIMKAVQQGGKLKLLVRGPGLDRKGIWYVDADGDEKTGLPAPYWSNGGGIELKISMGKMWRAVGGKWEYAGTVETKTAGDTMEAEVDLASIGAGTSSVLRVAFALEGDRYLPSPGQRMLAVPPGAEDAFGPEVRATIDGDVGEWSGIEPAARSADGLASLYAAMEENSLVLLIAGKLAEFNDIYLDTDRSADTGYADVGWPGFGGDWLIENGGLYKSTGAGWNWAPVEAEGIEYKQGGSGDQGIVEYRVPLAAIGIANPKPIAVGFTSNGVTVPSAEAKPPLAAPPLPKPAAGEDGPASGRWGVEIVADGDPGDWASVDTAAAGTGETLKLSAAHDSDKLYLLVEGDSVDTRNEFYLDTDGQASTGYKGTDWTGFGADAKIVYNKLYLYEPKTAKWKEAGPVRAEIGSNHALFYLYKDQLGLTGNAKPSVGYVGQGAYRLPAAGGSALALTGPVPEEGAGDSYVPRERFGVLDNPLMGWAGWATTTEELPQPHKLVYANIAWRDLEPRKGEFDWAGIERKYQFAKWKAEGTRINLRFVLDDPGEDPDMDIPQWLYDELVTAEGEDGAGKWYDTPDSVVGKGFAPNYSSPTLIAEHGRVLAELGKRYDNDPAIAYVQIGSLGHWGEFHNWPEEVSGAFPSLAVSDQYVEHYLKAFPHKLVGMRKPFPIAAANRLGLFNDVFGSQGATDEWLNWIEEGWNGIGPYAGEGEDPAAVQDASRMPNFWKFNFSGGEYYNGNPLLSLSDETIVETLREIRASHTAWLGPSSPAPFKLGEDIDEAQQANIDLVHNTMGYRFVLEAATHAKKASLGTNLVVGLRWNNKGVAPFYEAWPLALALVDSQGRLAADSVRTVDNTDIRRWLPGRTGVLADYKLPQGLATGEYTLAVAILDPATGKPGVHLGIEGERSDGWTELDRIQIAK